MKRPKQTLRALKNEVSCMDIYDLVFPGQTNVYLSYIHFRAPHATNKPKKISQLTQCPTKCESVL